MVGQTRQLAEFEQAVPDEQSFDILINNMTDGVIQIDHLGKIQTYNASILQLLDTNRTLTNQKLDQAIELYDNDGKKIKLWQETSKANRTITMDDCVLKYDQRDRIRLELTISPIKDSQTAAAQPPILGYIIILRDVTREKDLEEERDEFISVVSHELRTPITVAEGTISNLEYLIEENADKKAIKQFAVMAHDQIMLLAKMVNDLSSLARAERLTDLETEDIVLEELISNIYKKYTPLAESNNLALNLDMHVTTKIISTNLLYLEEILQNLIGNAIKYTKEGSVTIRINQIKPNKIEFAIVDTGIGIPKASREGVFKKFFRVEDYRTRETTGTGLGLYVCQKLAKKLGTKIELISRLNYGSTFSFILTV